MDVISEWYARPHGGWSLAVEPGRHTHTHTCAQHRGCTRGPTRRSCLDAVFDTFNETFHPHMLVRKRPIRSLPGGIPRAVFQYAGNITRGGEPGGASLPHSWQASRREGRPGVPAACPLPPLPRPQTSTSFRRGTTWIGTATATKSPSTRSWTAVCTSPVNGIQTHSPRRRCCWWADGGGGLSQLAASSASASDCSCRTGAGFDRPNTRSL